MNSKKLATLLAKCTKLYLSTIKKNITGGKLKDEESIELLKSFLNQQEFSLGILSNYNVSEKSLSLAEKEVHTLMKKIPKSYQSLSNDSIDCDDLDLDLDSIDEEMGLKNPMKKANVPDIKKIVYSLVADIECGYLSMPPYSKKDLKQWIKEIDHRIDQNYDLDRADYYPLIRRLVIEIMHNDIDIDIE